MSSEKSLTPQIRFKGFTEAWEQRKLGDIAAFSKGQGFSKSNLTDSGFPIILYGRLYTNYETQICKVDTFVKSSSCGVLSKGGEVIVPASGETAEDIAVASHVSLPGILLGGDLNVVTPKDNLDSNFLALFITFGNAHVELSKRAQGKSVVHVRNGDLSQLNIKYPTQSEQILISNLFIKNDNLITLHQRKLDALKKIKSALLEKMFPKDGSNIPEIRFTGFTEAWEQRKLGDIAAFSKGQGFSKSNLTDSGFPIILYGRLYTNYETQICKVDTFVKSSSCGVLSKGGEVIVPASGETAEDIAVASHVSLPGILLGGDLNVVTPKDNLDSNFLALFITFGNAHVELSKRAQGKSVVHVRNGDLSQLNIKYPTQSEQILISNLFIKNDNLITLHQRKLDALKKIKSALLEKMFV